MQNEVTDSKLTDKQAAFVSAYIASGGVVGLAAQTAGYASDNEGSRLLKNPNVINEIQKQMLAAIGTHAVSALDTMVKLSRSAKSDYVRLEASRDILDRAGFKPPDRIDHRVDGTLSVSFDIGVSTAGPVIDADAVTDLPP